MRPEPLPPIKQRKPSQEASPGLILIALGLMCLLTWVAIFKAVGALL